MSNYPRKVLVSPGYGAGFATWASNNAKALAEDPNGPQVDAEFLEGAKEYEHRNRIDCSLDCSLEFARRAWVVGGGYTYLGGVAQLEVRVAAGPYRITEYDGAEGLETMDTTDWW